MNYIKELTAVGRGIVASDTTMRPGTAAELARIFDLIDWGHRPRPRRRRMV